MVNRPIFVPSIKKGSLVEWVPVEFEWFPGFSLSQKQKSIESLHSSARKQGIFPVLEVSTKSTTELGRRLSAFNLKLEVDGELHTLESVYFANWADANLSPLGASGKSSQPNQRTPSTTGYILGPFTLIVNGLLETSISTDIQTLSSIPINRLTAKRGQSLNTNLLR